MDEPGPRTYEEAVREAIAQAQATALEVTRAALEHLQAIEERLEGELKRFFDRIERHLDQAVDIAGEVVHGPVRSRLNEATQALVAIGLLTIAVGLIGLLFPELVREHWPRLLGGAAVATGIALLFAAHKVRQATRETHALAGKLEAWRAALPRDHMRTAMTGIGIARSIARRRAARREADEAQAPDRNREEDEPAPGDERP